MRHLSMTQLLDAREPASDPGSVAIREHLAACADCRAELDRLHQRAARLRALPSLRPPRDRWPEVRRRVAAEQTTFRSRRVVIGGLALAASLTLAVFLGGSRTADQDTTAQAIAAAMAHSQLLERALSQYQPELRVTDGRTATIAAGLEDRIAQVDQQLQQAELLERARRQETLLRLWRERVGLMDALVDVHVTRARNVGL